MNRHMQGVAAVKVQNNKKLIFSIITAAAVLIALLAGIGIYNTPANRVSRHLELANRYLEEMDYEQAVVEFAKVIEIDPMNVDAYLGKAEAYIGLDNYDMAAATLEEGYLAAQEDGRIKENLIGVYLDMAENSVEERTYEERLEIYDRLLELDSQNEAVLDGLEKCLGQYINALLAEGKDDKVRALIEKYKDVLVGMDFDAFWRRQEMRMKEMEYASLLSAVRDLIIAEKYEQVNVLMQTAEYQDMLGSLQVDGSYYYGERNQEGNRDGMGIAVYRGYYRVYFYYGSWSGGERSGQGLAFSLTPYDPKSPYGFYRGEWAHDLPNGKGEERYQVIQSALEEYTGRYSLYQGSYRDGLYDGEIYTEVTWAEDGVESYRGMAENGVWKLHSEVENGEAVILICENSEWPGMVMMLKDNKDQGVIWLLPSSK